MEKEEECPLCYRRYNEEIPIEEQGYCREDDKKADGKYYVIKTGVNDTYLKDYIQCKHYFCLCCVRALINEKAIVNCPLCRCDISEWAYYVTLN